MKRKLAALCLVLSGILGSFAGANASADAAASCVTGDWTLWITPPHDYVWASCANTGSTQARGVLDCRWAPDPKTGWISGVGSKSNWWHGCQTVMNRGTRIDIRN